MRSARTRLLNGPELRAELIRARDFYQELGLAEVNVTYDTGFDVYAPRIIPTTRLLIEIEKSLAAETVRLGSDVIAIEDLDHRHNYRFGRDSNVSLTSADPRLVEERMRIWLAAGLKGDYEDDSGERGFWGPEGAEPDDFAAERERLRCDSGTTEHQRFGSRRVSAEQFPAEATALAELFARYGVRQVQLVVTRDHGADTASFGPEQTLPLAEFVSYLCARFASGDYRHGDDHIAVTDIDGAFELEIRKTLQLQLRDRVLMEEVRALWIDRRLSPR